jgi:hypothetical protein
MAKTSKKPLLKQAAAPVATPAPLLAGGADVMAADEITSVMASGFDESAAKKILQERSVEKASPVEAPVAPPSGPKKPMLSVQAVHPTGFRRIGYHFRHNKPTLLDPAKLTDLEWAKLDEAVKLHVLVVCEVEA